MKELFTDPGNAIDVVRWKEAYDDIAGLLARCAAVANALGAVAERYG